FFQAEDGIRDFHVTGVQTCALPIYQLTIDKPPRKRGVRLPHIFAQVVGSYGNLTGMDDANVANRRIEPIAVYLCPTRDFMCGPLQPLYGYCLGLARVRITVATCSTRQKDVVSLLDPMQLKVIDTYRSPVCTVINLGDVAFQTDVKYRRKCVQHSVTLSQYNISVNGIVLLVIVC